MSRTALFPGSFDPVTNGHLDLVRQAARLADRLVLAIGTHPGKAPLFDAEERRAMIEETCGALARASGCDFACITFGDLVVAAAQREGATLLIRGLRSATDFDYEIEMAGMNATMAPAVQRVFLPASPIFRPRNDIAPKHVERIKLLAREKYYDNVPFHRVIAGFMAQTGDGARGDGTGGSKYPNLPAEFSNLPFKRGVVGMARASDPNSANSQF